MNKEEKQSIRIFDINKSEVQKLHSMARRKGFNSLNDFIQFLLRQEIENELTIPLKNIYQDYFEAIKNTLKNFEIGYVKAAQRKKEIEKDLKKIKDLTDEWVYLLDPDLVEFNEPKELIFDEETGIVYEKIIEKNIQKEREATIKKTENNSKIVDKNSKNNFETRPENYSDKALKRDKEIRIRGLNRNEIASLKMLAKQSKYDNLNQFMLQQMYMIIQNGGLDIFQNKLAKDIEEIQNMLSKISNAQTKQELRDMQIIAKLDANIESVIYWIKFMSLVETNQII